MIVELMLAINDLRAVQTAPQPLIAIFKGKLDVPMMLYAMGVVPVPTFVGTVASMAATGCLISSLARHNIPYWKRWNHCGNAALDTPCCMEPRMT